MSLEISPDAYVSPDARIIPSSRGTRIVIGAHTQIYEFVLIKPVGGSGDVIIGEHCYINPFSCLYSGNGIRFGNYVLIAPGCMIVPTNHAATRRDIPIRHQGFMPTRGGVVIEDDAWIGANSTILDGAHIGKGAIVAAGSVVTGHVEPYAIVAGTPAKFIRWRDDADQGAAT